MKLREPTAEEQEQDLRRAAPVLEGCAEELEGVGYTEAASILREFVDCQDVHETCARVALRMDAADHETRSWVMVAIYDAARAYRATEESSFETVVPSLAIICEEMATLWGLPSGAAA